MSRVVVAAPYPTMPGPEASASLELVRSLVREGHDVTVVSPVASAAHEFAQYAGARGSIRLARLAAGADVLHLRVDVDAMFHDQESPRLLAGRLALSGLLRRVGRSELRLDRVPPNLHPRFASLVVAPATRVLVSTDAERDAVVTAGVPSAKVEVAPETDVATTPPKPRPAPAAASGAGVSAHASAADLQEVVRRRAAEERAARRRPARPDEGAASLPLRHIVRMERVQIHSNKPGGKFVKRLVVKLLAWQFDPVIASVNQLHQATIDAIDALDERQAEDDTSR